MGRVYKVFDRKIEEEVALKLLNFEHFPDEKYLTFLINELKLARRISHKNVCRMYHLEEEEGAHYITMEFVRGESLKSIMEAKQRLSIDEGLVFAKQICNGLAEAHRLGIIHRDMKTRNIMIDTDRNVRIMDFGLAYSLKKREKTEEAMLVGTPDYMPPEQAAGEEPGPESDIYSLGAIFFEMFTGRVPFIGETVLHVLRMHKTELPPDPGTFNDQIPEKLGQIILKCLEKDRTKRYQKVEEILEELECLERRSTVVSEERRPQLPKFFTEGITEDFAAEIPTFVKRHRELAKLNDSLEAAFSGQGRVEFVTGEAGTGKTALMREFSRRAQDKYPELISISGSCDAHAGIGSAYLPFREALNLLTCEFITGWSADVIRKDRALRLWNLLPLMLRAIVDYGSDLIGNFVAGGPLFERIAAYKPEQNDLLNSLEELIKSKAVGRGWGLQQSVLFEQFTRVLQTFSRHTPLLILLDDFQWADTGSINLLFHLGKRIRGSRILILGAYRPSEVSLGRGDERHPLESVVREFQKDFGTGIELGEAGDRDFIEAVIDTEPNFLGASFREILYDQTRGHPLFTLELLRDMKERGMIIPDREGKWIEGPALDWDVLPGRVDAVIEERINRLPDDLRDILILASVEGQEFTAELVAFLKNIDELDMIKILSRELDERYRLIVSRGFKKIDGNRLSAYQFRHILFQKYLYSKISDAERSYLHEKVGKALEPLYGRHAEAIAVQLARHFHEAGNIPKEIDYLEKAGERTLGAYAYKEAQEMFSRVIRLAKSGQATPLSRRQAYWQQRLGEAYLGLGCLSDSRTHLEQALAILRRPIPKKNWKLKVGILRELLRQAAHRLGRSRSKYRTREGSSILLEMARVYEYITEICYYSQEKIPAFYAALCALNLAERAGPSPELARQYVHLCLAAGVYSLHNVAEMFRRKALETALCVDPSHTLGHVSMITATYDLGMGHWRKVQEAVIKAQAIFHSTGDWRRWEQIFSTSGHLLYHQGKFRKSLVSFQVLYGSALHRGDIQNQYWGLTGMAINELRLGRADEAFENLSKINLKNLQDVHKYEKISTLASLSLLQFYRGDSRSAIRLAEQTLRLFSQSDPRIATLKAFDCVSEVLLSLWESSLHSSSRFRVQSPLEPSPAAIHSKPRDMIPARHEEKRLAGLVKQVCFAFHKYAGAFPAARPAYFLRQGQWDWLAERKNKARKAWIKGLTLADRFRMSYYQGLLHYEIGRHSHEPARQTHLKTAQRIFKRLGTPHNLAQTQAELEKQV